MEKKDQVTNDAIELQERLKRAGWKNVEFYVGMTADAIPSPRTEAGGNDLDIRLNVHHEGNSLAEAILNLASFLRYSACRRRDEAGAEEYAANILLGTENLNLNPLKMTGGRDGETVDR